MAPGTSRPDFAPVGAQPLPEAKMFGRVNAIAVKLKGELKGTQQPIGTPPGAAAARQFRHCLARAGITLHHLSNVPGRVPIMQVPAEYLGAFATSQQVYDFWIANSPTNAKLVARLLNGAMSERDGQREEAAFATGVVVTAGNEGTEAKPTEAENREVEAVGACKKALPKPAP
jgi:hypothetical protein